MGGLVSGVFGAKFPSPLDVQTPSLPPLHAVAEIQMYLEKYRENVLARATESRNGS